VYGYETPPSSAEVKNACYCASTPYVFSWRGTWLGTESTLPLRYMGMKRKMNYKCLETKSSGKCLDVRQMKKVWSRGYYARRNFVTVLFG